MLEKIKDKIAKLLSLAKDAGATDAEAQSAMKIATELMLRHGLSEKDVVKQSTKESETFEADHAWKKNVATCVATLLGVHQLYEYKSDRFWFVGRSDMVDAAEMMFAFLLLSVEQQYRTHLPKGLSKADRAEYRRSFKKACSIRLVERACILVSDWTTSDVAAQASTGRNALVVASHYDQLRLEAQQHIQNKYGNPKTKKTSSTQLTVPSTSAAAAGYKAGDDIELQTKVE